MNNEEKNGINWKQIVYTAVITSVFSLIVGLSIYYWTQNKPELVYEEYPSSNFAGENNNLGIINCRISNIGSKEANNILCRFSFDPTFIIKDVKIITSNSLLSYKEIQNNCTYTKQYSFQLLNPKENCSFSFLVDNYKQNSKVMITLRGDGINGKLLDLSEEKEITTGNIIVIIVIGLLVIFILMLVFGLKYSIKKTKKLIEKIEKHTDNERNKAFDAINIGVEYCDMGLVDESIAMLKKAIYQFPEESSAHSNIARAYAYKQDYKKSLMEIKIAEKLLKDDMDKLVFYYTSAQVYSLKNEKGESLKNLKKAYEIDPIRVYEKCQLDDDFDNIKDESSFKELKAPK